MSGEKIDLDGVSVYYEKFGSGDHILFLLPGVLGTIETDFGDQIKGFDLEKFTIVSWDPPGYGRSRPPERVFDDWFRKDAELIVKLVRKLEITKFSMIGFSDGSRSALLIAIHYPELVNKMVLLGCHTFMTTKEKRTMNLIRDISGWSAERREIYEKVYGPSGLQDLWGGWVDALVKLNVIIARDDLAKIKCPTFVVHGDKDVIAPVDPHATYLKYNIKNAKLHIYKNCPHWAHQDRVADFNKMVQEWLLK